MAHDNTNQMKGFMTKGSDCIGEIIGAGIREWGTGIEDQVSLTQGHLLFGAVAAEKEEAAATDGIGAGAGKIRGRGNTAEEDEPVPEGAPAGFGLGGHGCFSSVSLIRRGEERCDYRWRFQGRGLGGEGATGFFAELEMP